MASKKQLNVAHITNELNESAFFAQPSVSPTTPAPQQQKSPPGSLPPSALEPTPGASEQPVGEPPIHDSPALSPHQSINRPVDSTIDSSVDQSTHESARQATHRPASAILDRPKAFYITERLDRQLDEAVRYLQEVHGIRKADRSTLVNAILDNDAYWTGESLDLLVDRVIRQLTSRLTGK